MLKIVFVLFAVAAVVTAVRYVAANEEAAKRAYDNDGK